MAHLLWLLLRPPGSRRGLTLYRGRRGVVTTPRGREELDSRRRARRLLVAPGAIENLPQRAIRDEQALPATLPNEREAPQVTE